MMETPNNTSATTVREEENSPQGVSKRTRWTIAWKLAASFGLLLLLMGAMAVVAYATLTGLDLEFQTANRSSATTEAFREVFGGFATSLEGEMDLLLFGEGAE
jgi:CHASE3 domain sensor protein